MGSCSFCIRYLEMTNGSVLLLEGTNREHTCSAEVSTGPAGTLATMQPECQVAFVYHRLPVSPLSRGPFKFKLRTFHCLPLVDGGFG